MSRGTFGVACVEQIYVNHPFSTAVRISDNVVLGIPSDPDSDGVVGSLLLVHLQGEVCSVSAVLPHVIKIFPPEIRITFADSTKWVSAHL